VTADSQTPDRSAQEAGRTARSASAGHLLTADDELCTRCGICAEVCPRRMIVIDDDGPRATAPQSCAACGHCVAVCPEAALTHARAPLAGQTPLQSFPVLDPATAATFLRSRRSIRTYKPDPVPREKLLELLELARFAPTGGNSQGLSYLVVTDRAVLDKATALTVDWLDTLSTSGLPSTISFADTVEQYRTTGADVILRGAPCLVVATAPRAFMLRQDNARFCLEYAELYATTLGLGTCWAGFFQMCAAAEGAPLPALLGLPEETAVAGALMVGYPKYRYQRLVDRDPLQVSWL